MSGGSTSIKDPASGEVKKFTFDYSYNSFDSKSPDFADQKTVFKDLGKDACGFCPYQIRDTVSQQCLRRLQLLVVCLWSDGFWQILLHDGM